jgi:hypothetical protein
LPTLADFHESSFFHVKFVNDFAIFLVATYALFMCAKSEKALNISPRAGCSGQLAWRGIEASSVFVSPATAPSSGHGQ